MENDEVRQVGATFPRPIQVGVSNFSLGRQCTMLGLTSQLFKLLSAFYEKYSATTLTF